MKRFVFVLISIFVICITNTHADEIYYTNPNAVSMTESQYNFLGEMYFDGYQDLITQTKFNYILTNGYFNSTIEKVTYEEQPTRGSIHETNAKRLTITKACNSYNCFMVTTLHWKGQPNVKSYDVIGALLYGSLTLLDEPETSLSYSGGSLFYGDEKYSGTGFGTSVKLQTSTTLMNIFQEFTVSGTGTVYASYQHATTNITKSTSQKYTCGYGGYGGVFHFYGSAVGVFDQMGGVNMYINV